MSRTAPRSAPLSRSPGAVSEVKRVLTDRYQSAGLITAQVLLPPDAVCRRLITGQERLSSVEQAKTNIVMRTLSNMHIRGEVERRKNNDGIWEYRTPRRQRVGATEKRGAVLKKIMDAIANGVDPYSVHDKRSTVSVYLWRLNSQKSKEFKAWKIAAQIAMQRPHDSTKDSR